jgi:hypothetical protein
MYGVVTDRRTISSPKTKDTVQPDMIAAASSLLIPLALSTSLGIVPPSPSYHRDVSAFVTGYNTVPGQTDSTPCIAASGANICGRRDAVACPRRISLGTIVEIRGATYVCEDRLAKKFDNRFDISCDKDMACPYQVAGWATIKVFDIGRPQPTPAVAKLAANSHALRAAVLMRIAQNGYAPHVAAPAKIMSNIAARLMASAGKAVSVLRGNT